MSKLVVLLGHCESSSNNNKAKISEIVSKRQQHKSLEFAINIPYILFLCEVHVFFFLSANDVWFIFCTKKNTYLCFKFKIYLSVYIFQLRKVR